jgi:hypothetical protein
MSKDRTGLVVMLPLLCGVDQAVSKMTTSTEVDSCVPWGALMDYMMEPAYLGAARGA